MEAEQKALQDKTIAMREILSHINEEKQDYQVKIRRDVERAMADILDRLKKESASLKKKDIETLENRFAAILARDSDTFREAYAKLSPREIEICELIKEGTSTKDISSQLNLSPVTVHKHREHIRKKLSLTNQSINLSSYLRTR